MNIKQSNLLLTKL